MAKRILSGLLTFVIGAAGGAGGALAVSAVRPAAPAQAAPAVYTSATLPARPLPAGQPEVIADLVDRVGPAVVNIDTISREKNPFYEMQPFFSDPFFGGNPFFGGQRQAPYVTRKGIGSGFIIDSNGLIVTNNHVVADSSELTVTLPDGKKFKGRVVGKDSGSDLAVVKIDGRNLPTLPLANPKSLRVGQWVVAIGSPLGLQHTVTAGILSAMNRPVELNPRVAFLQTDAPINPGNSGGPLLNLQGEVIGVNTAVARDGQGIGFAIPVSTLQAVIPELKAHGKIERVWLGVEVSDLPEDRQKMFYPSEAGALVHSVTQASPAAKIGLQPGDVILEVDGKTIHGRDELILTISQHRSGDRVKLLVSRESQKKVITATLERMPEKLANAGPGESNNQQGQQPQGQQPQEQGQQEDGNPDQ